MNEIILAKYRTERAKGLRATNALSIALYTVSEPTFPFLADLTDEPMSVSGEVSGFDVTVQIVPDEDSRIGEDDVTGWFTDSYEPGCIRNTVRDWNSDAEWYRPSNYDLNELPKDGSTHGMSKQVAREYIADRIRQAMREDAERYYWGVVVTIELDGFDLASASLWSIDSIPDYEAAPYLREVAEELIPEAMAEADERAHQLVEKLTNR